MDVTNNVITNLLMNIKGLQGLKQVDGAMDQIRATAQALGSSTDLVMTGLREMGISASETNGKFYKLGREGALSTVEGMKAISNVGTTQVFEQIRRGAMSLGVSVQALEQQFAKMGYRVMGANKVFDTTSQKMMTMNNALKLARKQMYRFNMNTLTILFTMMYLKNVMAGMFRSFVTTYQKANEETQGLGKATWHLQAAWEFFKYSVVDALTQNELFMLFVKWLLEIVKWLNKIPSYVKGWIAIASIILLIAVSLAYLTAMFWPLIEFIGLAKAAFFKAFFGIALILLGVIFIILGFKKVLDNWGKDWLEVSKGIIMILMGLALVVAGIAIIMGAWLVAGIALAVVAILALVLWVINGWKQGWEEGIKRLIIALAVLGAAFLAVMVGLQIAGIATAAIVWLAWIGWILLALAVVALVVFLIIKYWDNIKIFFLQLITTFIKLWMNYSNFMVNLWKNIVLFIINLYFNFLKITYKVIQWLVNIWIDSIFIIPQIFAQMFQFVIEKAKVFVRGLLGLFEGLPGIGNIVSSALNGLDNLGNIDLSSGLDNAKSSIKSLTNSVFDSANQIVNTMQTGMVDGVNYLADSAVKAYNSMGDAALKTVNTQIDAIKEEMKAREEANKKMKADEEAKKKIINEKTTTPATSPFSNILPTGTNDLLGSTLGLSAPQPGSLLGNQTNNQTVIVNDNKTINANGLGKEDVMSILEEQNESMLDSISRKIGSNNN